MVVTGDIPFKACGSINALLQKTRDESPRPDALVATLSERVDRLIRQAMSGNPGQWGYKHFNHEGGIAAPFIAHWPAQINARGEPRQQPGHLVDIMLTVLAAAGARYPAECKDKPIQPLEGRNLLPAFENQPIERDALYWEHEGNAAVRVGNWKRVRLGQKGAWELYDLSGQLRSP